MPSLATIRIYLAIRSREDRSKLEDQLVLDGADVSSFANAGDLWDLFQARPARFIVTDQRFGSEFTGLELVRRIRKRHSVPYVYVLMRSMREQLKDIQEGLKAGVDGYLVKPHNPFQIRSQVLVGLRWLTYIDSINAPGKVDGARAKPATRAGSRTALVNQAVAVNHESNAAQAVVRG
jgi:DNA-binding response OmpR family regulator